MIGAFWRACVVALLVWSSTSSAQAQRGPIVGTWTGDATMDWRPETFQVTIAVDGQTGTARYSGLADCDSVLTAMRVPGGQNVYVERVVRNAYDPRRAANGGCLNGAQINLELTADGRLSWRWRKQWGGRQLQANAELSPVLAQAAPPPRAQSAPPRQPANAPRVTTTACATADAFAIDASRLSIIHREAGAGTALLSTPGSADCTGNLLVGGRRTGSVSCQVRGPATIVWDAGQDLQAYEIPRGRTATFTERGAERNDIQNGVLACFLNAP